MVVVTLLRTFEWLLAGFPREFFLDMLILGGSIEGTTGFSAPFCFDRHSVWLFSKWRTSRSVANAASTQIKADLLCLMDAMSLGPLFLRLAARVSAIEFHFRTSSYMDRNRAIVGRGLPAFDEEQRSENILPKKTISAISC